VIADYIKYDNFVHIFELFRDVQTCSVLIDRVVSLKRGFKILMVLLV